MWEEQLVHWSLGGENEVPQRTWDLMVVPNLLFFPLIGNIGVSWNENYRCQGHCEIQYFIIVCLSSNCPEISFRYRFACPYLIFPESFLPTVLYQKSG